MPTSATSRRTDRARPAPVAAGFTLLEMVVVLAILGLVTAMTAPSMLRSIDSWQRQAELDALTQQVQGLPAQARGRGRSIEVSELSLAADDAPLRVEAGGRLSTPAPWRVRANGVCDDGELVFEQDNGRRRTLRVQAPFCDVRAGWQD